ncbi:hypothetical protein DES53_12086 [Roseimicrobium gellanilyticum]|uniref:Uncharacterized protein n=1 Tax=Roseimicrobium gellanilyticum TaxID=748857 RepID=A0A366H1V2_9BACT|nr:hypothetical protein [Roseimicrobium gellanilyticum]RBP35717.1 hypothetical protein DES53_12086 [Roseimicrobium gellanilyticum]
MRLRTISLLSLLPLWLCLFSHTPPLSAQDAAPVPVPPDPLPAADAPLQTQAQTPVHAQPGPTISSSVSSNKQFVVHGGDLSVRSAFCLMSEETAGTLGRLLKDEGRYAIPVVVEVKTPPNINPAEPTVRPRISLMDYGGFHLQLSVQLRNDFRREDYTRELVRILLAERILRNHKDINTQREKDILPEWLLTGVMQAMDFRSRNRPSVLFAAVFKSGQVYSIDRILAADPKNLDALARGVYEVSSCALLLTLLDQPDGPLRVAKFFDALATDDRPDRDLLQQHFPTLGASKNSLEKWWTLQMASLATPSAFETMTIKETEEMLDKALTLHFTDRIGEEPEDIKAGREGKGIFGWLKRDDKAKEKSKPQEVTAALTNGGPQMPVSNSASSALPVEGSASPDLPAPLGKPAPGTDLPPLPSSLPPPSPDNQNAPGPAPQDTPPPMPAVSTPGPTPAPAPETPSSNEAAPPPPAADAPKEKEATKPAESEAKPKPEPAPEKPKTRRTAPKPAAKPAEPKPATPTAAPDKANATPAAPTTKDKATDKPADTTKPEEAAPEEKKERKRFRFPNIFGGKDVTYTLMLLAMAAVAENTASASAKEKENQKPAAKEEQKAKPEETVPALPRNNRRVGARPAGLPETQEPAKPAATPAPVPAPKPAETPKTKPEPTPVKPSEAAPATAEEGQSEEKKGNRFNPLKWFKREEKEKKEEETPPANAPGTAVAEKPASTPPKTSPARAATDLPEKAIEPPTQPSRAASRSSSSGSGSKIKPELAALDDYRRIWKRSDREDILNRNLAMLNALKLRAHPLYKPLVDDYASVVQQLLNGKDRGIAEKLETLRQRRMQIQGKAKSVESFLDWYEASETQTYSNLFDDYLKLRDRLERERAQRPDELSRELDALEKEYE